MSEVVSFFLIRRCHRWQCARFGSRMMRVSFFITMIIAGWSLPLKAQKNTWNHIFTFDRPIGCGYFFDENHGLLGSGIRLFSNQPCAIFKTTDGGQTFTPSVVPTTIPGAVTSISMIDSLNGFASIFSSISYPNNGTFGRSALWVTTDGGDTWFDPFHLDHVLTSVYAQNGLIQITKWDDAEAFPYTPPDPYGGDFLSMAAQHGLRTRFSADAMGSRFPIASMESLRK